MISIIIPFNNTKYLQKCLENLSKIKYDDFEIVLINDYADINPEQIISKFEKNLNLKYYETNEKTIGVGNARNLGIEKANGEYIMFVDVDDTIEENLLSNLQEYMDEKIELIKYKMKIIKNGKEFLTDEIGFDVTDGQDGFNKLCYKDKYLDSPCLYLIKRNLFEETELKFEKNVYHEDFGLIPQLIVNAKSFVSINYYGYKYFQSENSIMRNDNYNMKIKKIKDKFFHYQNIKKNIEKYNLFDKTKNNLLSFYTNSIIMAMKDIKVKDRKDFERKIKNEKILDNLKVNNFKQFIKKIMIETSMEMYFKWQK